MNKKNNSYLYGKDSFNNILIRSDIGNKLGIDALNHATIDPDLNREINITDFNLGEDNYIIIGQDEDDYKEIEKKLKIFKKTIYK